jgi:type IV pilus assembly protein PilB
MVGEIRDLETAAIAVKAALTGHLVLSTLHTNDAPSTITRLQDMGLPAFLISSSLLMVIAQRLVRRICLECREPIDVPVSALLDIGFRPEEADSVQAYVGKGCAACAQTGFRGRVAIHEVMALNDEVKDGIVRLRPANEIKELALKAGMRTLRQAGLRKVATGITTIDEVLRVTFAD